MPPVRKSTDLLLVGVILILSILLGYVVLYKKPNTGPLKQQIKNLSNANLTMSRRLEGKVVAPPSFVSASIDEPNDYPIQYQLGTEGPLKFYTSRTNPKSTEWQRVGNIFSESTSDDTVLGLEQRSVPPFLEDSYEYRAVDNEKGITIQLPAVDGRKLENGDTLTVPGKESVGTFVVARDKDYYYARI